MMRVSVIGAVLTSLLVVDLEAQRRVSRAAQPARTSVRTASQPTRVTPQVVARPRTSSIGATHGSARTGGGLRVHARTRSDRGTDNHYRGRGDRDRFDRHGRRDRGHGHRHHRGHGYWKTVQRRVWVPGHWDEVHVPAEYGWALDACGNRIWTVIRPAYCKKVWHPGYYTYRSERVWCSY